MPDDVTFIGVPLMIPVNVLNIKPSGNDGVILYDVGLPAVVAGIIFVITIPRLNNCSVLLYDTINGKGSILCIARFVK